MKKELERLGLEEYLNDQKIHLQHMVDEKTNAYAALNEEYQVMNDGVFKGTFGVFRDISERKKVEAKLEQYMKELQESNATKDK